MDRIIKALSILIILAAVALPLLSASEETDGNPHWAFEPVTSPPLPTVIGKNWIADPLDHFILAKLEGSGLFPSPVAGKSERLRRASFAVKGLPPSKEEQAAFLDDPSPEAWPRAVDHLLDSPHYGERWARHWLDLVRYAETKGHEFDFPIPNAWQYRDYLIRAFNADVSYNQFVREHVAGDLLDPPRLHPGTGGNESILGTGFWWLGDEVHAPVDIRGDQVLRLADKVDVFTKTFLGLTVGCARCHDHKFDPITTEDYYSLSGFILSANYRQARFETMEHNRPMARALEMLNKKDGPRAATETAASLEGTSELPRWIEAALEVYASDPDLWDSNEGEDIETRRQEAISKVAKEQNLEASRLAAWIEEMALAASSSAHPLSPLLGLEPIEAGDAEVLFNINYADLEADDWLQDGFVFGSGPLAMGTPRFSPTPDRVLAGVQAYGAAASDPLWASLKTTKETQAESIEFTWSQAGRVLRTPTWTLIGGQLHYLVGGAGHVFAEIDGHRVLQGPLHLGTILSWEDKGWRWISHDLTDYAGHRIHLEFSPGLDSDLSVAMVAEGKELPFGALVLPPEVTKAIGEGADRAALAQAYGKAAARALRLLAEGTLSTNKDGRSLCLLANTLLRRPGLLDPISERTPFVQNFLDQRAELLSSIDWTSSTAPALLEGNGVDEFVLRRGDPDAPQGPAPRRYLSVWDGPDAISKDPGSGRLALAHRLTDPDHPEVARVLVNRVWHHLFGKGLVPTVDDLGSMGQEPSHLALLNHLTHRFVQDKGSVKTLIRSILLSSTWQQSGAPRLDAKKADPTGSLLARMPIRRLDAEALRDSILAVSGQLDPSLFGTSVPIHLTPFMDGRGRPGESGPVDGDRRRSLYLSVRRNFTVPFLSIFDFPSPGTTRGRRSISSVPSQALALMNDPFVVEQAGLWAQRLATEDSADPAARVEQIFREALARSPDEEEAAFCLDFLSEQADLHSTTLEDTKVWADLCHAVFNLKEFRHIP